MNLQNLNVQNMNEVELKEIEGGWVVPVVLVGIYLFGEFYKSSTGQGEYGRP